VVVTLTNLQTQLAALMRIQGNMVTLLETIDRFVDSRELRFEGREVKLKEHHFELQVLRDKIYDLRRRHGYKNGTSQGT
jgi:hypothetical protein